MVTILHNSPRRESRELENDETFQLLKTANKTFNFLGILKNFQRNSSKI